MPVLGPSQGGGGGGIGGVKYSTIGEAFAGTVDDKAISPYLLGLTQEGIRTTLQNLFDESVYGPIIRCLSMILM